MHVLFVHPNFPAQFGHIAHYLADRHSYECTFASMKPGESTKTIRRIQFKAKSGAQTSTHFSSRTFENQVWNSHSLFETLAARDDIRPDLIVGHTGFVSTLYLRELYDCPIINYFEYFYRTQDSDVDFRQDLPSSNVLARLRTRTRNAWLLLDLENCDAGYSPTEFQRSRLPDAYRSKVTTIFDGIDTTFWKPEVASREALGLDIPGDAKIVTYVSRGLESMRGFDIFMRMAKRICDQRSDVIFLVIGEDRVAYGGDLAFTGGKSFKEWVLGQDDYDLSRIRFLGRIPPQKLRNLFSVSDLHMYWTVPFTLSWSLMNALSCGTLVACSDTAPVHEMIQHKDNGLLFDFFDVEQQVELVHGVLDNRRDFDSLSQNGLSMIHERYSMDVCLPKIFELYNSVIAC